MATKKGSTADRFSALFDQDWAHTKSRIRTRVDDRRVYDPTNSWDSRSDNPRSFSRLDQTAVPFQKTAPIVLSGAAVVPLEENTGFSAINVKHPDCHRTQIPLTQEQRDVGMGPDLSGQIPLRRETSPDDPRRTIVIREQPGFAYMSVKGPELAVVEKPAYILAAGPQANEKLLNPRQRREFNVIEKQEQEAAALLKKAAFQRSHTKAIMGGPFYKRGVLMVDSSDNIRSEVYGERATEEFAGS